jgi:hypothetical protein
MLTGMADGKVESRIDKASSKESASEASVAAPRKTNTVRQEHLPLRTHIAKM